MLNVIFTRMEMQAMEVGISKNDYEIVELCEVDEAVQSDEHDPNNQEVNDESIIIDLINEMCDSTVESFDCDTKTKELAQDIVRSMSQVICLLLIKFALTYLFVYSISIGKFGNSKRSWM